MVRHPFHGSERDLQSILTSGTFMSWGLASKNISILPISLSLKAHLSPVGDKRNKH